MIGRLGRMAAIVVGAALGAWWVRLIAHSKVPPPEGRWRELEL
jgi:hypothetical protein